VLRNDLLGCVGGDEQRFKPELAGVTQLLVAVSAWRFHTTWVKISRTVQAERTAGFWARSLQSSHSAPGQFAPTLVNRVVLSTARKQIYLSVSGMTEAGGNRMYNIHAVNR
jgi:hypothetical protein